MKYIRLLIASSPALIILILLPCLVLGFSISGGTPQFASIGGAQSNYLTMSYITAFASNSYAGTINIANNCTAATNVCAVATIDTASLISAGYASANMSNTNIQNNSSVNVPYMPAISGNTTWSIFVSSIGTTTLPYKFYTGGADMSNKIRYFPGTGGMTVADNASFAPTTSGEIEWQGYLDATVGGYLLDRNDGAGHYSPRVYFSANGTLTAEDNWGISYTTSVSGVTSGEKNVKLSWNGTTITLTVGASSSNTTTFGMIGGAAPYIYVTNNVTPYVEYIKITADGVLRGYWYWENAATFTDHSGYNHTATPSFRTTSSNACVSASLIDFKPVTTAQLGTYTVGTSGTITIFSSNSSMPTQMYTENDTSTLPGAEVVNALLDASGTPRALWWYLFLYISIGIIGMLTYELTTMAVTGTTSIEGAREKYSLMLQSGAKDGSLLMMCIVIEFCLIIIGLMGATPATSLTPFWPAILFVIVILALISSQWSVKTS